jgi:hypothetical protein
MKSKCVPLDLQFRKSKNRAIALPAGMAINWRPLPARMHHSVESSPSTTEFVQVISLASHLLTAALLLPLPDTLCGLIWIATSPSVYMLMFAPTLFIWLTRAMPTPGGAALNDLFAHSTCSPERLKRFGLTTAPLQEAAQLLY